MAVLFFWKKHRIPSREEGRLLVKHLQNVGRDKSLLDDETEHIVVEPLVGHDEVALVARVGAPAVLHHPLHGLAVLDVHGDEGHGV